MPFWKKRTCLPQVPQENLNLILLISFFFSQGKKEDLIKRLLGEETAEPTKKRKAEGKKQSPKKKSKEDKSEGEKKESKQE